MKIQIRQSIYTSIAFGVVFVVISLFIYLLYANNAKKTIYQNLEKTAYLIAFFHLEEDEMNSFEFEPIKKQFAEIVPETSYQIYDENNRVVFGNKDKEIPLSVLRAIRQAQSFKFSTDESLCYGIFYEDNQGDFIIVSQEAKTVLSEQLTTLLWILVSALIAGMVAVVALSRWLSRVAYKPISSIMDEVNNFSLSNSCERIQSPHTKDELQELTETFNLLLDRISESFTIQRNFVNYVSHEFRTPLASMLGNLEVFSLKDRTPKEYETLSHQLILQIRQLEEIIGTLISISDLHNAPLLNSPIRLDELVWEIMDKISFTYPKHQTEVMVDILPPNEEKLIVHKERTQLLMALYNIVDNAVKYSQGKAVNITIYEDAGCLCLSVEDRGIGIPPQELDNIKKPFYRADNTNRVRGSGIGLSIALRILENNNIKYKIESQINIGTNITICFE